MDKSYSTKKLNLEAVELKIRNGESEDIELNDDNRNIDITIKTKEIYTNLDLVDGFGREKDKSQSIEKGISNMDEVNIHDLPKDDDLPNTPMMGVCSGNIGEKAKWLKVRNIINKYLHFKCKLFPDITAEQSYIFTLAYLSYMMLYSTRKPFSVVKMQIQQDLNLTTTILGWIDTTFLGSYAIGQLFIPTLFESVPAHKLLCIAFMCSAVCSTIFGSTSNSSILLTSWFFNGLFHAGVFPLLVRFLVSWFSNNQRGKVLGLWTTSQQAGAMISTAFAAAICTKLGWRAVFYIPACAVFIFGIIIYNTLMDPPYQYNRDRYIKTDESNCAKQSSLSLSRRSIVMPEIVLLDKGNNSCEAKGLDDNIDMDYQDVYISTDKKMDTLLKSKNNNMEKKMTVINSADSNYLSSSSPMKLKNMHKLMEISLDDLDSTGSTCNSSVMDYNTSKAKNLISQGKTNNREFSNEFKQKIYFLFLVPNLVNIAITYFFIKLIRYSLLFWLPYYLIREMNYDPSIAGYSSMLFDIGGIFGAITAGIVADAMFQGKRIMVACYMSIFMVLSLLFFIFITKRNYTILILLGIGLMGFFIAGPDSVLGSTAAQDTIDNSGFTYKSLDTMAAGLVNGLGSLGAVVQGTLTAYISEIYGWDALFFCLFIFGILAFLILIPATFDKKPKVSNNITN
ncbi:major facilitator superfamily transporter [Cryptosporidium muris RN66]|uniref:Major facilitator superfamily protein n=1 Tax=Cryptosporidium muris (strain RN66) TaxID=441375 RepID=B6AAZ5_CRYMR|nr:major facilitator superfamily transporter [Cryptosporidium muris RN66]EEA05547.1 major facilitator superfamily protein [Cryptosporidium muris RN66]|eukprot:XP_002139896.1 major facilitator superfamily transporter [Cryptosporidium muris RN66]